MNNIEKVEVVFDQFRAFRSLVIASKMMNYFIEQGDRERANIAFLLGYVHDIGYFLGGNVDDHQKIGGEILKMSNYEYFREVYFHGTGSENYFSDEMLILELADMTTSDDGRHIRINESLDNIRTVYGESSAEYKNFLKRITFLENNCNPDTLISIRDYFNNLAGGSHRREVKKMDDYKYAMFFEEDDAAVFTYDDFEYDGDVQEDQ